LWQKGNYNEVFANLTKDKIGDKFTINKSGIRIYTVYNIREVNSDNYLDLEKYGNDRVILMTCIPLGTNLRRLLVEGRLTVLY
jgi:LPXTG-site transpeptidase (sortase) family protein